MRRIKRTERQIQKRERTERRRKRRERRKEKEEQNTGLGAGGNDRYATVRGDGYAVERTRRPGGDAEERGPRSGSRGRGRT